MSQKTVSHFGRLAMMVFASLSCLVFAADDAKQGPVQFDDQIDNWVSGSIVALDATAHKFTVRGTKMPYASEYSAMEKDIAEKTAKITDNAARQKRADEIRNSYNDKLNNAKADRSEKQWDYTFVLPNKSSLNILDEKAIENVDFLHQDVGTPPMAEKANQNKEEATPVTFTSRNEKESSKSNVEKEAEAEQVFKNLHIGDRVMVGFEKGIITSHEAFVVIKRSSSDQAPTAK